MTPQAPRRLQAPPALLYEPLIRGALAEDLGIGGDITSRATIAAGTRRRGSLVARQAGILAGLDVALTAFAMLDEHMTIDAQCCDGQQMHSGETIATLEGEARALLGAERTALNVLAHLCGIATATARYVMAVGGAQCVIADTRKTLPGLRMLQKYAVRVGGGANHRLRLDDAILIKDNHIALAGGIEPALRAVRTGAGHLVQIEIEVDTLAQLDTVLDHAGDFDAVLLDNFSLAETHEAVRRVGGRMLVEASGGITLDNVAHIARAGVDIISVGALTHSVEALDIGLDISPP